jgi:hypothetical protein
VGRSRRGRGRHCRDWRGCGIRASPPALACSERTVLSLSHPTEDHLPWAFGLGGSDADFDRQVAAYEQARLSKLSVSYEIENHGSEPVRDVKTGARGENGTEVTFEAFSPMLGGGEHLPVASEGVPRTLHAGMQDENRAERFTFWVRFTANGRRWEATYDPRARALRYKRRGRSST